MPHEVWIVCSVCSAREIVPSGWTQDLPEGWTEQLMQLKVCGPDGRPRELEPVTSHFCRGCSPKL